MRERVVRSRGKSGDRRSTTERLGRLKNDLTTMQPREFVMHWLFDVVPSIFDDCVAWTQWKLELASKLDVDASAIVIVGSGCVGFSLNPNKRFREFNDESDIDVAIVSGYHFEIAWRYLRDIGAGLYNCSPAAKESIKEHRNNYLFWATIATDRILPHLQPFGQNWMKALAEISQKSPVSGRAIKVRVYRDTHALVGYHINNVSRLRNELLAAVKE